MTRSAPSEAHSAPFSGPAGHRDDPGAGGLAQLDAGGAEPAGRRVHDQGLAGLEPPPLEQRQVRGLERQQERGRLGVVEARSGASNTEMASAMAYSAMPPSAFLVMATTRLPEPRLGALARGVDDAADVHARA